MNRHDTFSAMDLSSRVCTQEVVNRLMSSKDHHLLPHNCQLHPETTAMVVSKCDIAQTGEGNIWNHRCTPLPCLPDQHIHLGSCGRIAPSHSHRRDKHVGAELWEVSHQ